MSVVVSIITTHGRIPFGSLAFPHTAYVVVMYPTSHTHTLVYRLAFHHAVYLVVMYSAAPHGYTLIPQVSISSSERHIVLWVNS